MLTNDDIHNLISLPKVIEEKDPAREYHEADGHRRCSLKLRAKSESGETFRAFVNQNMKFTENFSVGLNYLTGDSRTARITLVRYNGPHGEYSRNPDGHFAAPHIHRITEEEIASGSYRPQERHREITDRYTTFEQALRVFFTDIAADGFESHFPNLIQLRLINES